ncbi:hypothetical protein E2P81_ATG07132 [Venturia nashicola]|nr:hypothetical protein E2P81_ATG07132 [Venturia nashicola]
MQCAEKSLPTIKCIMTRALSSRWQGELESIMCSLFANVCIACKIRHQADKNTGLSAYSWMPRHGNTKLGLYDPVSVSSECATNISKDVSVLKCSWKLSVTLKLMREQFNGLFCGRPSGSKAASRHSSLWTHSVIGDDFS